MSPRTTLFGLYLGAYGLSYFFRSANAVIAGDLRADFDLDAGHLGLMTSTFFAALALAQLPLGSALDRWGERLVVPVLMASAAVGALVFATAGTVASLTLGRALLGLGFAAVLMGALKAFGTWFPDHRFATASSLLVGIGTSGRCWRARRWHGSRVSTAGARCSSSVPGWWWHPPPPSRWPRARHHQPRPRPSKSMAARSG
jgi:MFS family permease